MTEYKIQKLTKKYLPYFSKIMQKRWDLKKEEADNEARKYLAHDGKMAGWVVLFNEEPVGTALFDIDNKDVTDKYSPWLSLLWIEPEHRGKSLGITLTRKRMDYARKQGYKVVYLDTVDAREYHKKQGWEEVEEIDYHGEKDNIMKWDLSKTFPKK